VWGCRIHIRDKEKGNQQKIKSAFHPVYS
jgi:hypothetical protein